MNNTAEKIALEDGSAVVAPASESVKYTGILPCQAIWEMVRNGEIRATKMTELVTGIDDDQIQPASIDLRLGDYAYPVDTSFLPGKNVKLYDKIKQLDPRCEDFKISLLNGAVLEKERVYVIPLLEEVKLKSDVKGFANPKSSTGRLDILTRLITDEGTAFDEVARGYEGRLYLEVVPRTFGIVVKRGTRLSQLRFRKSRSSPQPIAAEEWHKLVDSGQVVRSQDKDMQLGDTGMLRFTVDLRGSGKDDEIIGWRAKKNTRRIDLEQRGYDPLDFWEPLRFHKEASLILDPSEFYILMTKEAIAVPPDYAAEMLPYDTRAGEFLVHYAGFFDPGFGWSDGKAGSSRGVLEVRSHEVPFLLEHGQTVGWLRYERMAARPEVLYGQDIKSNYQGQSLKLAKQFKSLEVK
jgi:dCTP deaminase